MPALKAMLLVLLLATVAAPEPGPPVEATHPTTNGAIDSTKVRFISVDVFIESNDAPLAAYQFDFVAADSNVRIVGLEGGEHAAFAEPPYYDAQAMTGNRVIAAAFSTNAPADLPSGRVRIATVHAQLDVDAEPRFEAKLVTAANADGEKIEARISTQKGHES